jgi:hypothetical protein
MSHLETSELLKLLAKRLDNDKMPLNSQYDHHNRTNKTRSRSRSRERYHSKNTSRDYLRESYDRSYDRNHGTSAAANKAYGQYDRHHMRVSEKHVETRRPLEVIKKAPVRINSLTKFEELGLHPYDKKIVEMYNKKDVCINFNDSQCFEPKCMDNHLCVVCFGNHPVKKCYKTKECFYYNTNANGCIGRLCISRHICNKCNKYNTYINSAKIFGKCVCTEKINQATASDPSKASLSVSPKASSSVPIQQPKVNTTALSSYFPIPQQKIAAAAGLSSYVPIPQPKLAAAAGLSSYVPMVPKNKDKFSDQDNIDNFYKDLDPSS